MADSTFHIFLFEKEKTKEVIYILCIEYQHLFLTQIYVYKINILIFLSYYILKYTDIKGQTLYDPGAGDTMVNMTGNNLCLQEISNRNKASGEADD